MNRNILLQHPPKKIRRRFYERKTLHPLSNRVATAREKINAAKARLDTWRAVGAWLGDSHKATACNRLALSVDFWPSADLIEQIETTELPPVMHLVEACPDCGGVHTSRCHGKTQPTVKPARTGKPAHRPYIESDAMWDAYKLWAAEWRRTQEEQP